MPDPRPVSDTAADDASVSYAHVVHLVGPVTDSIFGSIGAITASQAEQGIEQTVILVDEPSHRHLLPRFHPSVRLVLTPAGTGPLRRAAMSIAALVQATRSPRTVAVHLHGLVPGVLGFYAFWFKGLTHALSFSPARSGAPTPSSHLGGRARQLTAPAPPKPARRRHEVSTPIENSVDPVFFSVTRREARRPLVVASSRTRNPNAVALFAQLAVLLSDETLDVSCNWYGAGATDADSLARLAAANVATYELNDASARAARLGSSWIYIAFGDRRGFAIDLAEAMAAGVPCVVWSTPKHRELVEHGKTALCCQSHEQLLACVAELIDSPSERERLGRAAREEARRRFDDAADAKRTH